MWDPFLKLVGGGREDRNEDYMVVPWLFHSSKMWDQMKNDNVYMIISGKNIVNLGNSSLASNYVMFSQVQKTSLFS